MDALKQHTSSVAVQFSGNKNTYHYLIDAVQWTTISRLVEDAREVRVVVPGKVKDDRLSLSISTVVGCQPSAHADAVLPIAGIVHSDSLELAQSAVLYNEEKAAAFATAQGASA